MCDRSDLSCFCGLIDDEVELFRKSELKLLIDLLLYLLATSLESCIEILHHDHRRIGRYLICDCMDNLRDISLFELRNIPDSLPVFASFLSISFPSIEEGMIVFSVDFIETLCFDHISLMIHETTINKMFFSTVETEEVRILRFERIVYGTINFLIF